MVSTRKVMTVFMASPGDVSAERAAIIEAVSRLNSNLAREIGWHVEVRGWEQTHPGMGRPQSLINPEVDSCDVFIGILWKRWGSPTKKYSSGFYEEYVRARERFGREGQPRMGLFFRTIEPASAVDPGEQLRQVLNFKTAVESEKALLFRQYSSPQDFAESVNEYLSRELLAAQRESPSARPEQPSATARPARELDGIAETGVPLEALHGNETLDAAVTVARWSAARRARELPIAPCAIGLGISWCFDPLDTNVGTTIVIGMSGSGKTMAIDAMLLSVAFSLPPELVRFGLAADDRWDRVSRLADMFETESLWSDPEDAVPIVARELQRRAKELDRLGLGSVRSLWKRYPERRAEFPAWVLWCDEAFLDKARLDQVRELVVLAGGGGRLGVHVILGSQQLHRIDATTLVTRTRRVALRSLQVEFEEFTGSDEWSVDAWRNLPGLAVVVDGETRHTVRFAKSDIDRLHDLYSAARSLDASNAR